MSAPFDLSPALIVGYRQRGLSRADELEELLGALRPGDPEAAVVADIRRIVHMVKGSGGSYGFPQLTEAATSFETCLDKEIVRATLDFVELLRHTLSSDES